MKYLQTKRITDQGTSGCCGVENFGGEAFFNFTSATSHSFKEKGKSVPLVGTTFSFAFKRPWFCDPESLPVCSYR
jgi:hypothetical protein